MGPKTTGNSFFDKLQQPASFTTQSNDPAGFGERSSSGQAGPGWLMEEQAQKPALVLSGME